MPEMQSPKDSLSVSQLFSYPFRIFFLSLAVQALLVVPMWVGAITGRVDLPLALSALQWHQHEMMFAWLSAAIAGFLLTAVCVWTGTERTHGWQLAGLWGVWLVGRLLITLGEPLPYVLIAAVNLLFLPLVMLDAGLRIWRARQGRQVVVLLVLAGLWIMQLGFLTVPDASFDTGALIMAMTLMLVIGGRITPNFSMGWLRARGFATEGILILPWLERSVLIAMAAAFISVVLEAPAWLIAVTCTLAGTLSLIRILLWRGWRIRSEPLLWILHLSLLWIPIGLFLLSGSAMGWWGSTVWVHAIGLGAMGGLILGVISRVALGHTGRTLTLPKGMTTAFVLIHLGALVRVATGLGGLGWQLGVTVSALLWVIAFAIFLYNYTGILCRPRADGKPG